MVRIGDIWIMPYLETQGLSLSHPKIWKASELVHKLALELSENRKENGQQDKAHVVFTNGCYDILHPGHVALLEDAKKLGEVLVLALNSDDSVRRLGKGKDRPIQPLSVRAFMAAHLQSVDYVTAFDEDTPLEIITLLRPNILVKGGDWPVESIVGADFVQSYGGLVYSLPLLKGYSTTALVQHIRTTTP